MKFSLKSLIIVVTLFALLAGIVTSIYRWRMNHVDERFTQVHTYLVEDFDSSQNRSGQNPAAFLSREPEYKSQPFYCKIAIGLERKKVVLTAADLTDQIVYVDLNANGDLTEDGEWFELVEGRKFEDTRYFSTIVPEVRQGNDTHTNLKIKYGKTGDLVKGVFSILLWGWDESTTDADLVTLKLTSDATSVPLLHFNGPLTMGSYREITEMPRGKDFVFYSLVGTPGSNGGTLTAIVNNHIPDDAHPMAEFEFPHCDSSQPSIKLKTFLNVRC